MLGPIDRLWSQDSEAIARRALEAAKTLGHNYVGTEHLLLALICDGFGPESQALDRLGIRCGVVQGQVISAVGRGRSSTKGVPQLTPAAERVLELAVADAATHGSGPVRDTTVLRALIDFGQGVAFDILQSHGDTSALRHAAH